MPIPDLGRTDFLLIVGANPLASHGSERLAGMAFLNGIAVRLEAVAPSGVAAGSGVAT